MLWRGRSRCEDAAGFHIARGAANARAGIGCLTDNHSVTAMQVFEEDAAMGDQQAAAPSSGISSKKRSAGRKASEVATPDADAPPKRSRLDEAAAPAAPAAPEVVSLSSDDSGLAAAVPPPQQCGADSAARQRFVLPGPLDGAMANADAAPQPSGSQPAAPQRSHTASHQRCTASNKSGGVALHNAADCVVSGSHGTAVAGDEACTAGNGAARVEGSGAAAGGSAHQPGGTAGDNSAAQSHSYEVQELEVMVRHTRQALAQEWLLHPDAACAACMDEVRCI